VNDHDAPLAETPPLLIGRTAIVTGAGQGVGEGIARALAAAGANVVIAARRLENGEPAAAAIRDRGQRAICVQCDVGVRADVERTIAATVAEFGGIDIVVHNAVSGVGPVAEVQDGDDDVWAGLLATALRASYLFAHLTLPHLREREGSSFLILTSPAGVEGSADRATYGAVKAGQRGFAKSLAREWGPLGIRVNCIAPVAVTPAMERAYVANPALEARLNARTPLGRIGAPEPDIGGVAVFLSSHLAQFVTGQTIVVDGGGFLGL
jgi:NAD(P)-dependent dehydrogenase (short-subunit alcohol dehydrogenase family)